MGQRYDGVDPAVGTGRLNNNLRYDNKGEQWGYNLSMSGPFALLDAATNWCSAGITRKRISTTSLAG
jgi:hypothetical protein